MRNHLKSAIASLVLLSMCTIAFAQQQISGTVRDVNGEPVVGAGILVKGTTNGAITDLDGKYMLTVPENATLIVSCIGYSEITQPLAGNQSVIDFMLKEDVLNLDDAVVIGYQTVKRRDLTGSVASIGSKELSTMPVSNIAQALQGKLAGVNVVSQDGRPDATINIRVRGGGSITQSNEPLILIDGVTGTLSDIPSDQVESIDILKDASSTAIYGARGANGVVLVTTKGAREGKVRVSYNGYAKFNTPTGYIEALSPYEYLSYVWANSAANGPEYVEPFSKLFGIGEYGDIERYRNLNAYDIQKKVYNSSFSHSHDLTISGGNDHTRVLFSVNYSDEDGMKINSYNRRSNVALKLDQKISDRLNASIDVRYTDTSIMSDETAGNNNGSLLSFAYRFRPIATEDILGNTEAFREGAIEQYGKFPLWDRYDPYNRILDYEPLRLRQNLISTASLNWNIVNGLTYHTDLSLRRTYNQSKTWSGAVYNSYMDDSSDEKQWSGAATLFKGDSWGLRWTNTLNYDFTLAETHRFNLLVGQELSNSGGDSMTLTADHFPANFTKENAFAMIDQFDKENSTVTRPFYSGHATPQRILSYFGRINYSLLNRYLFTLTFRADGSSKFAPSHRWGYFPAAAFAWRISEEPFMKNTSWMDDLKLRLSFGSVGNDGISSDLWAQNWTSGDSKSYYAINGVNNVSYDLASSTMANPDLKWETTITRNLGLDFGVLGGRLSGTVDLYWNTTKDLLMNTTLPGITGFTSTYANIGQTSNKGLELSLNAILVQTREWGLSIGGNINFNRNNVDKLADGITGIYGSGWFSSGNPSNDYGLEVNKPVGLVRGLIYEGFYTTDDFDYNAATGLYTLKSGVQDVSANITGVVHGVSTPTGQNAYPGMAKFQDTDGNGTVDAEDYTVIGDMNADFTGGFNINANYQNWDLGLYFNYSVGNEIYNVNRMASLMGYKETAVYQNHMRFLKDAYKIYNIENGKLVRYNTPEQLNALNADAKYPLCYNENGVVSTLGIESGSYLRLNTLSLGYTLPGNSSIAHALRISALRFYGTVYNLLTLTKYNGLDPEVSVNEHINNATYPTPGLDWGSYPRARSFVLGMNVSF